jgi:hypothetical protein
MVRNLVVLLVFFGFLLIFTISCVLASYCPETWAYLFGGGLLLGGVTSGDYNGKSSWRLPALFCVAAGVSSSAVVFAYPASEILGLYLAVVMLIVGSTWWWRSPPLASA